MKKFILMLMSLITINANAQLLFTENFTGDAGTALTSAGWLVSGTSNVSPITVNSEGLTYPGYESVSGNSATLVSTGQDVYKSFTAVSSGSVYLSFLLNVSVAQASGDYFIALSSINQTNYIGRLHIKSTVGGFLVGIKKSNDASALYGSTVLSLNSTYLITMKYTFIPPDTTDDILNVYVMTNPNLPATEPTPEISTYNDALKTDAKSLGFITLRQGSATAAPTLKIDGIRIATEWNYSPLPVELTSFTGFVRSSNRIELKWATATEVNNYGFYLEKLMNESWTKIKFIPGNGTSNSPKHYEYVDNKLQRDNIYRLNQVDNSGAFQYSHKIELYVDIKNDVFNNYPNPFNPSTTIKYSVDGPTTIELVIYNILGIAIQRFSYYHQNSGLYSQTINLKDCSNGSYFYQLKMNDNLYTKRMNLIK